MSETATSTLSAAEEHTLKALLGNRLPIGTSIAQIKGLARAVEQLNVLDALLQQADPEGHLARLTREATSEAQERKRRKDATLAAAPKLRRSREWLQRVMLKTLCDSEYHATEADLAELEAILR